MFSPELSSALWLWIKLSLQLCVRCFFVLYFIHLFFFFLIVCSSLSRRKWEHNTYLYPVNGAVFSTSAHLMSPIVPLYLSLESLRKKTHPSMSPHHLSFWVYFSLRDRLSLRLAVFHLREEISRRLLRHALDRVNLKSEFEELHATGNTPSARSSKSSTDGFKPCNLQMIWKREEAFFFSTGRSLQCQLKIVRMIYVSAGLEKLCITTPNTDASDPLIHKNVKGLKIVSLQIYTDTTSQA